MNTPSSSSSSPTVLDVSISTASTPLVTPAASRTIPNFSSYRTVEATYADLAKLAADNPNLATWVDIGDSYDKVTVGGAPGYDIFALQLGKPQAAESETRKPVLFLQGAIYGESYITAELATRFAEMLVARYGIDPEATWLLDYFDVRIVPIVNPDGRKLAEQGLAWRKNANPTPGLGQTAAPFPNYGVDLDRNFDVQWGKVLNGASTDPAAPNYQGSAPFSEPESKALRDYLLQSFAARQGDPTSPNPEASGVFIDLRGGTNQIWYANRWTTAAAPDYDGLRNLGLKLGYFTGRDGVAADVRQASTQSLASGTVGDWVYQTFGAASYTVAAGSKSFEDSSVFESTIVPEVLPALFYAAKASYRPYQAALGPDVQALSLSARQVISGLTNSVTLFATVNTGRFADSNASSLPTSEGVTLPTPQIAAGARYSIDAPSWAEDVRLFDMSIAEGDYDSAIETMVATIDTTGLAPGRHTLFVEGLDASGAYGVPTAIFLDVLQAPENASVLRGTEVDDTWTATDDANFVVLGREGDDKIQTATGRDLILAGIGDDVVVTNEQDDILYGDAGDDQLNGGAGNDKLYGEADEDVLLGGEGDDLLWGGAAPDELTGGAGRDTFVLVYNEAGDTITDFNVGEDFLGLAGTLQFSQLSIVQDDDSVKVLFGTALLAELNTIPAGLLTASSFVNLSATGSLR